MTIVVDSDGFAWKRANPAFGALWSRTLFPRAAVSLSVRLSDLARITISLRGRNWWTGTRPRRFSCYSFFADLVFVAASRADVLVVPFLILLLGWRQWRWKGALLATLGRESPWRRGHGRVHPIYANG